MQFLLVKSLDGLFMTHLEQYYFLNKNNVQVAKSLSFIL